MSRRKRKPQRLDSERFAKEADEPQIGLLAEFWDFLLHNKKWWLTPIVLVLLAFGALIVLTGTPAAPFIYALF